MKWRWFITKKHLVCLIGLLVAAILAMLFSGCTSTSERSQTYSQRTQITERHPTPDGGYVEKVTEFIEGEKSKETTTKADINWEGAVLKAGAAAATGDWAALGGVAGTLLAAGGMAYVQHRRVRRAEENEDETYNDLKSLKENPHA